MKKKAKAYSYPISGSKASLLFFAFPLVYFFEDHLDLFDYLLAIASVLVGFYLLKKGENPKLKQEIILRENELVIPDLLTGEIIVPYDEIIRYRVDSLHKSNKLALFIFTNKSKREATRIHLSGMKDVEDFLRDFQSRVPMDGSDVEIPKRILNSKIIIGLILFLVLLFILFDS